MATLTANSNDQLTEVEYLGYRKHSSGDLHSRLKTRKLLGVGETDDGDVHRSKLSQILGHSEQLYVRLPRGLRPYQLAVATIFSVFAFWSLLFPGHLLSYLTDDESTSAVSTVTAVRFYGVALLSFTVLLCGTLYSNDKDVIRWSLLANTIFCILHTFVVLSQCVSGVISFWYSAVLIITLVAAALPSGYFYWLITSRHHHYHSNKCADGSWLK